MLRSILLAVAISLVAGSVPALAQFKGSCNDWCVQNRCAHGALSVPACVSKCTAACKQKHPNAKS
jgi:hypothetical protein